jgi:hypothetical protein
MYNGWFDLVLRRQRWITQLKYLMALIQELHQSKKICAFALLSPFKIQSKYNHFQL